MGALGRGASPPTVASVPGAEADKLLQRFRQLDPGNQAQLLNQALFMIDRQRDARLPPREREAKRLFDRIERCLELIAEAEDPTAIGPRLWRDMVTDDRAELAALGIDYFSVA